MSINQISTINVQEFQPNVENEDEPEKRMKITPLVGTSPNSTNYCNLLHVITILGVSAIALSPQLLIPRHNPIYYPDYWQVGNMAIVVAVFCAAMRIMMDCIVFAKEKSLIRIGVFLKMNACYIFIFIVVRYSSYFFWTSIMGFEHPMPLLGILQFFVGWPCYMCFIWRMVMFPSELRMNNAFKIKIKTYVLYEMWWMVINMCCHLHSRGSLVTFSFCLHY